MNLFAQIAKVSTERPKLVLLIWLIIFFVFSAGLFSLSFRADHRIFFSEENELLKAHDNIEKTFSKNDNILFVISSTENHDPVRLLKASASLTDQSWYLPFIRRVDSVTNFQHSFAQDDTVNVESLLDPYTEIDSLYAQKIISTALAEPLLLNRLIAPQGNVIGVASVYDIPASEKLSAIPSIVKEARKIANQVRSEFPGVSIRLTGSLMMDNAFAEASEYDLSVLTSVMLVLMLVLLGIIFKTFIGVIATVIVIVISIVVGVGAGGYLGIELSSPSLIAPNIILTLAIADCIHLIWGVIKHTGETQPKNSIYQAVLTNARPIVLTSLTTAVGFMTLNFSDSPPFNHLGTLSAIGVIAAMCLSLTFLPAFLVVTKFQAKSKTLPLKGVINILAEFVIKNEKKLLLMGMPLTACLFLFVFSNEIDDQYINYFSDDIEFRRDTDFAAENLTGIYYIDYHLNSGEEGGISNPSYLKEVEAFSNWYQQQSGVLHVFSMADVVKKLNRNFNQDDAQYFNIPNQKDLISQYLFMYEMSLPKGLDLRDRIDTAKSSTRMTVILDKLSTNSILELESRAAQWSKANTKILGEPKGVGTTIMFSNVGINNIESMLFGTFIGLLIISLILTFVFKSIKIGIAITFTNLMPALTALGAWGLLVGQVGLAVSVLAAMTLGIVVDDTIHFIERFMEGRRKKSLSPEDAVRYAFDHSGTALLTTTIVLACGFLVLALSSFQVNAWMGLMTTITILIALIIDFLLLPPILMRIEK